ncbi:ABC transporter permease [soil metagenome]
MAEASSEPGTKTSQIESPTPRRSLAGSILLKPEMGAIAGAVAVWIVFILLAGDSGFLTMRGTASYLEVSAQLGILAIAVALLMIGGEFDLSIGSTIGACGMIIAILASEYDVNLWLAIGVALIFAILIGFINGYVVVKTGLPSFIVTLAMLFMIRGATIGISREITGRTQIGGLREVPGYASAERIFASDITIAGTRFAISIVWWIVLTLVATWVLLRTPFGNWISGAGGNLQAARNVGVPTTRVKILLFVSTSVAAWLLATILAVKFTGSDVLRGQFREFYAIVAVVIGGTLLTGGYGSAIGAALGALIFGMVQQGIVYAGIDADWFQFVLGAGLLAAVLVNRFVRTRSLAAR